MEFSLYGPLFLVASPSTAPLALHATKWGSGSAADLGAFCIASGISNMNAAVAPLGDLEASGDLSARLADRAP
jgi:hypothetical protein